MARNYIGKVLSSGVVVLCILALFAPQSWGQRPGGRIQMFTISGNVGAPGVTMQGFPVKAGEPQVMTDDNGVYTAQVRYGWSGTVTPVKPGYTFEPKQRAYTSVTEDKTTDDYKATMQTFVIAGNAGKPGVRLRGLPEDPNSGPDGRYSVQVPFGWSGVVTPELEGFVFEPPTRDYNQIADNKANDNYTARVQTFAITGSAGAEGVLMKGFPGEVKTSKDGSYKVDVPYKWSGKVTPVKEGYEFTPEFVDYNNVTDVYANQDYTARVFNFEISGSAGMAGVVMGGLPGEPITDETGHYSATVEYGWSGKISPTKAGYSFKPAVLDIAKVTDNKSSQDFTATIMKYTISGTTGVGGAKLTGLPTEMTSGSTGTYTVTVEYGWSGSITADKEGYTFDPPTLILGPIEKDLPKQDFRAKPVTSTIAGNVGMPGVLMQGLPGRVVSGADGSYTVEVPFKWSATVTPMKDGFSFEPAKIEYKDVRESLTAENYLGSPKRYTVSGRILSDKGTPVADVVIMTGRMEDTAMTDANGEFKLTVDHGWTGKLSPNKDGCTFSPVVKPVGPITANLLNQGFTAKMKMVTITDKIELQLEEGKPAEPVQGVTIKDKNGEFTATTNAKGEYTIQVPYNWSGELFMSKPGIIFEPESILYQNVIEDQRFGMPVPKPATGGPTTTTTGPGTPSGTPTPKPPTGGPTTTPPVTPADGGPQPIGGDGTINKKPVPNETAGMERVRLEKQLEEINRQLSTSKSIVEKASLQRQIDEIKAKLQTMPTSTATGPGETITAGPGTPQPTPTTPPAGPVVPSDVPSNLGPIVSGTFAGTVIDVLIQVAQKTNAKVYADATVKPDPIQPVTITAMPMASALPMILKGSKYSFRRVEEPALQPGQAPTESWQVFLPITNTFGGDELPRALQDISSVAGVPISSDETVQGRVYADLQGVPLEVALETILAGTSYVAKREANYYLVADRKPEGTAFDKISVTRRVRLNYISPSAAKNLLSSAFTPYVQADIDPNTHVATVTAPEHLAARIVDEMKELDVRPRHVLLDARIVAMERGDLLNIGVEWGMPSMSAGLHDSSYLRGTQASGTADPAGNWPWGVAVGLSFDNTFTNALTAALNLLKENDKLDILSSPQVVGRDGKRSRIQVITEEYFMMSAQGNGNMYYSQSQLETVKSGTTLEITPLIGDNNDITLELAVEVSDSVSEGRASDLPVVTRRTAQNYVTIRDGGTVAVAGLTENRTREQEKKVPFFSNLPLIGAAFRNKNNDKATREIAVFVTAHLVPENSMTTSQVAGPAPVGVGSGIMTPAGDSFQQELRNELSQ